MASSEAGSAVGSVTKHRPYEDALAMLIGTLFVSFGAAMFGQIGLLTGGTAGLAFLAHYATGVPFGWVFFVINLPFYYLAVKRMGWPFTAKTFAAVALVSVFSSLHPHFVQLQAVDPFYAAVMGGLVMGTGFIILFRHQTSLGGIGIVALFLQDRYGIRAGKVQMGVDLVILAVSYFFVGAHALAASVLGAVALNLVIAVNHRPGRYMAL